MAIRVAFLHLFGALGVFLVFLNCSGKTLSLPAPWKVQLTSESAQDTPTLLISLGLPFSKGEGLVQVLSVSKCL